MLPRFPPFLQMRETDWAPSEYLVARSIEAGTGQRREEEEQKGQLGASCPFTFPRKERGGGDGEPERWADGREQLGPEMHR